MEGTCQAGHENPATNRYCGTCGTRLLAPRQTRLHRSGSRGGRRHRRRQRRRALAVAGVAVLALGAAFVLRTRMQPPGEQAASAPQATTTTSTTAVADDWAAGGMASLLTAGDDCASELITWLEFAYQPDHSFAEVAAELGRDSPEWLAIAAARDVFETGLADGPRSQAVRGVLDEIDVQCAKFDPGFDLRPVPADL